MEETRVKILRKIISKEADILDHGTPEEREKLRQFVDLISQGEWELQFRFIARRRNEIDRDRKARGIKLCRPVPPPSFCSAGKEYLYMQEWKLLFGSF